MPNPKQNIKITITPEAAKYLDAIVTKQTDDTKPFIHGSEGTHDACREMIDLSHQNETELRCCACTGHVCKEGKSFFDLPESEQKEIMDIAAKASNKAQQELMETEEQELKKQNAFIKKFNREQVCICLDCGKGRCHPMCKVCTPLLDTDAQIEEQVCTCSLSFIATHGGSHYAGCPRSLYYKKPLLDTEAWEKEYAEFIKSIERDEVFITEGYAFYDELKDFIHTLLKNKESSTLQALKGKVEALKVPEDWNKGYSTKKRYADIIKRAGDLLDQYNSALDDVLKLIDE